MNVEAAAANYARALLDLAREKGALEEVRGEVSFLLGLHSREKALWTFVESPRIPRGERRAVFERALRGRVSDHFLNFLLVVFSRGRQLLLLDILRVYGELHDQFLGIVRASVTTAVPLSSEEGEAIGKRLASVLGKRVEIERRVDAGILGGFVIRYDGMVADASIRSALAVIGERMLSVRFGREMVHEN
jgi:F-type H+-transporting ATPase subunit delta